LLLKIAIVVLITTIVLLAFYFVLRFLRYKNCAPKLLPGQYLKQKWNNWTPGLSRYGQVSQETSLRQQQTAYTGAGSDTVGLDAPRRGPSVRSIISLPSYTPLPKPEEQVIARAGERGGMDIVVEFPESAEEEESRREQEMDSLYRIRLQRRQEIAEREERRRQRREAREGGDYSRLQQISVESIAARQRNNGTSAADMLAEHRSRSLEQRVASVSYAELGQVRHDGSRIRASSNDSDQRPLLDAGADPRASLSSVTSVNSGHSRAVSSSSVLTLTTTNASNHDSVRRTDSSPGGRREQETGDLSAIPIPPPEYDHLDWGDVPGYESPIAGRGESPMHLSTIHSLPSIRIDVVTPSNSTPATPATPRGSQFTPSNESHRSAATAVYSPSFNHTSQSAN
jgi:hypothetical protein